MSLNWSVDKVKDWETVCYDGDTMNPVTHSLLYATISAGIPTITEANAAEFFARITLIQQMDGKGWIMERAGESDDWQDRFITADEVRAHVGLSTNATVLTRSKFLSSLTRRLDEAVRAFNQEVATSRR